MNFRLFDDGVKVNVIRSRLVRTASYDATFGDTFHRFLESLGGFEDCYTTPEEVANVVLMVAGGFCDAIGGQVITVDKGFEFFDNLMGIAERARFPCIGTERADLVVAGCAILEAILDVWPAERLAVADRGIREGILRRLMGASRP